MRWSQDRDIVLNYGINHALVGSLFHYQPINEEQMQDNQVVAEEFVFGNKYQIIPKFSLCLMRREYFILWKDENINNEENMSHIKFLLKREVNIYSAENNDEAINIIQRKNKNKMKIITNCGPNLSGKQLIEYIRNEFHYNFIILVFASHLGHITWVRNIPNVILTTEISKFFNFIMLEMTHENVMNYIRSLEDSYDVKFNINEE